MASKTFTFFGSSDWDCGDKSHSGGAIFFDFITKNMAMPPEMGELVAYVLLMIISWYAIAFACRFLLSLVKPVFIVLVAMFLFRILHTFEGGKMKDLFIQITSFIMSGVSRAMEMFLRLLD